MKKILFAGAALAATLAGGLAIAQPLPGPRGGPDANQDGIITEAEVRANVGQRFAKMDANSDGKIDKADREARTAERFKKLDTDGSGEVSLAEMKAGQDARHEQRTQRMAARRDAGPGEQIGGMRRGKRGHGGGGHGMRGGMMRMDANKDGAITLAEMEAGALERFKRQDSNNDGQVTKAERDAAHEAMKQRWQDRRGAPRG